MVSKPVRPPEYLKALSPIDVKEVPKVIGPENGQYWKAPEPIVVTEFGMMRGPFSPQYLNAADPTDDTLLPRLTADRVDCPVNWLGAMFPKKARVFPGLLTNVKGWL